MLLLMLMLVILLVQVLLLRRLRRLRLHGQLQNRIGRVLPIERVLPPCAAAAGDGRGRRGHSLGAGCRAERAQRTRRRTSERRGGTAAKAQVCVFGSSEKRGMGRARTGSGGR